MFRRWKGSSEKFRNLPKVRTEPDSNPGVKPILSPSKHFPTSGLLRSLPLSSGGFVAVCCKSSVSCVVCAGCCDVVAPSPSPPTCHKVKCLLGCLHGDGESQEERTLLGIQFPAPPPGAIDQALWEKDVTLPVSSSDITWNNPQALPGQWERA